MRVCPRCQAKYAGKERFCQVEAAPLVEDVDFARLGTTLGNYLLLEVVGRGGMGTVFRGEHVYIKKPVAVKLLHDLYGQHAEAVQRFLREAQAASSIQHPNIVDVTDFGPVPGGGVYFVMEYLDGRSLGSVIEEEAPIELHRAITIVNQIASALAAAHDKGIVHRDLKPENVMLIKRPGRREIIRATRDQQGTPQFSIQIEGMYDFVKVLDFGIAKVVGSESARMARVGDTSPGVMFGTPTYMAPEAALGEAVDLRADIYALGVILFELVTGVPPFEGASPMDILLKHAKVAPPSPRELAPQVEITPAIERLLYKALAKRREDRHQDMDELRNELQYCFGSVAYRRHAAHVPGAREAGLVARERQLTDELGALLSGERPAVTSAGGPLVERLGEGEDTGPVIEAGSDEAPLLLTRRKPRSP